MSPKSSLFSCCHFSMHSGYPPGSTTPPPCFEGVGPLSEDGVLDPSQHRDGSIYTATGLCTAFTVASLGDLGGFSSCIGRALGEIRARKPLIHGAGKCMRALRWQYPYFGLRLRVIDMGLATKYLIMVI